VILGAGSFLLAAGIATWLTLSAGPNAVEPVAGVGALAAVGLVVTLAVGRPEGIAAGLLLLGAAYAVILVVDRPSLDARSAMIGAGLLAAGELGYLCLDARSAVTDEAGAAAHRLAWVALLVLLALALAGAVLAVVDLLRAGGIAIEVVGAGAAIAAVGLLVAAAHEARQDQA
jgi:hypothetical protein